MNLLSIVKAYIAMYKGDEATVAMAEKRTAFCSQCPHLLENPAALNALVGAIDHTGTGLFNFRCGLCSCIIPAKTSDRSAECPDGRWGKELLSV